MKIVRYNKYNGLDAPKEVDFKDLSISLDCASDIEDKIRALERSFDKLDSLLREVIEKTEDVELMKSYVEAASDWEIKYQVIED